MTSYIFAPPKTKCQIAQDLVKQYQTNRKTFIQKAIKIIIATTKVHINEVALSRGKTELRVNVDTVVKRNEQLTKLQEELHLKEYTTTHEERKPIVEAIIKYFEDSTFVVSSSHDIVTISWK